MKYKVLKEFKMQASGGVVSLSVEQIINLSAIQGEHLTNLGNVEIIPKELAGFPGICGRCINFWFSQDFGWACSGLGGPPPKEKCKHYKSRFLGG